MSARVWNVIALSSAAALGGAQVLAGAPHGPPAQGAATQAVVPAAAAAAAASNRFDILEYRVLGNRVLPPIAVERAVYPFLGPDGDLDTVKKAVEALEKAYREAGYGAVFVDIPEQSIDEGVVRLKVTEGRLERVRVHGARYFSERQIRAAVPSLVEGETPHLPTLQRELTAVNARSPDRSVTPILKSGSEPGTVDADLLVKDALPLHGSIEADDRHTAATTPNRASASLSYDNLWQRQDSLALQYQTAPAHPANATVESASYLAHVDDAAGEAALSYIHTSSNVLALGTLGVLGRGDIYGARWLQPLAASATSAGSLTFGVDYKSVLTEVFPDVSGSTPVLTPVHYLNWSGSWSGSWRLAHSAFSASFAANFGIRGLVNHDQEFANARYDGTPDYLYLRLSGAATQKVPGGITLLARFSGQWAASPLVNNEQYSLGGVDTVRGYLEAEFLGDSGAAGTFELQSPPLGKRFGSMLAPLYAFAFVDGGVATLEEPLPAQFYRQRLWSTGGGLRLESPMGFSGALDYAIAEADGIDTRRGQGRIDFSVRYGF